MPLRVTTHIVARVTVIALVAILASVAIVGCARPETAADRHFLEHSEQLTKLEASHDTLDARLGGFEGAVAEDKNPRASIPPAGAPNARALQLGGPSEDEAADPNDTSARPDIRVTGTASAASSQGRAGRAGRAGGRARIEASDASPDSESPRGNSARSSVTDPDAKAAYDAALAQVQSKQYDRGLEGLNAFLVRWPDHPYAENALYWRGEAYFAQGEYLRAAEQFEGVLARFGSGNKGADTLLKLGMCQERLGAPLQARAYWDRLKNEFPRSEAAKRIPPFGRESSPKGSKENR